MDWFLYDNDPRHERVNEGLTGIFFAAETVRNFESCFNLVNIGLGSNSGRIRGEIW